MVQRTFTAELTYDIVYFRKEGEIFNFLDCVKVTRGAANARDSDCSVCIESIAPDSIAVHHPGCRNSMHIGCMDRWVAPQFIKEGKASCPYCRAELAMPGPIPPTEVAQIHAKYEAYSATQNKLMSQALIHTFEECMYMLQPLNGDPEVVDAKGKLVSELRYMVIFMVQRYWEVMRYAHVTRLHQLYAKLKDTNLDWQSLSDEMASAYDTDLRAITLPLSNYLDSSRATELFMSEVQKYTSPAIIRESYPTLVNTLKHDLFQALLEGVRKVDDPNSWNEAE